MLAEYERSDVGPPPPSPSAGQLMSLQATEASGTEPTLGTISRLGEE